MSQINTRCRFIQHDGGGLANNDTVAATQGESITYTAAQLLGNDTDVDSANLRIVGVTSGAGGTVVLNADGTVASSQKIGSNSSGGPGLAEQPRERLPASLQ